MMKRPFDRRVVRSVLCVLCVVSAGVTSALGQERPQVLAEFTGGWVGFPDDGLVSETVAGGTLSWFVSPRLSLGPEASVVQGSHHRHILLAGNVMVHLAAPDERRVTPYVVVAGGLFQSRFDRPAGSFTTRDGMIATGAGLRGFVSRRISVGAEARAGWETHLRVTGSIGVKLGAQ